MRLCFWRHGFKTVTLIISCCLILTISSGRAEDFYVGARGGASFDSPQGHFYQGEAFAGWEIPWHWNFYSKWCLRPVVDASAGGLTAFGASGFVGTSGPILELHYGNFPVFLEGGSSPTYLSQYVFGGIDLGERFQFTSHLSLQWDITKNFAVNARFQHMSDAGLTHTNPGLNIEMLCLRFNF
jgi:hypothetical protein